MGMNASKPIRGRKWIADFVPKPLGLLTLLDEETTFPNRTDMSFANKLKQRLKSNPCFRGERGKAFTAHHYAGEVCNLSDVILFYASECAQIFASSMLSQSEKPAAGSLNKSGGVDSQKLRVMLKFKQLKCCGVLEVVRISRSGFPTRMTHQKFARRYGFLLLDHVASQNPLSVSVAILHHFDILPEMNQVGYSKLFFRIGQIGKLEDTRNRTLNGILRVQSCFRGHKASHFLREMKRRIFTLQSFVRGQKDRNEFAILLHRHRAAVLIQKWIKGKNIRKEFKKLYDASDVLQAVIRRMARPEMHRGHWTNTVWF